MLLVEVVSVLLLEHVGAQRSGRGAPKIKGAVPAQGEDGHKLPLAGPRQPRTACVQILGRR